MMDMEMDNKLLVLVGGGAAVALCYYLFTKFRKPVSPIALQGPSVRVQLTLREALPITHNTKRYRFNLPSSSQRLGLPVGRHLSTVAMIDGEEVMRTYTPTSSDEELGYVDLVIKRYPHGLMSNHINSLSPGDPLTVMGPKGMMTYNGKGRVKISGKPERTVRNINMICGGTGITPMLQLIRCVLKNPDDPTRVRLIFGNVSEDDVILGDELRDCAADERFDLFLTLDKPPQGWEYGVGYVTREMIEGHLAQPGEDVFTVLCGPKPMVDGCKRTLLGMGFDKSDVHAF